MSEETPIQYGEVTATYFWDDGSGINGDTGAPASGEPMQQGLFSSPSWPLGTEGYIVHEGRKAEFFIGDRGPGAPSRDCDVLLDVDGKTFAEITGEEWDETSYTVSGGDGHLDVEYYITEWGDGSGTEGAPHPFQQPGNECEDAVAPVPDRPGDEAQEDSEQDGEPARDGPEADRGAAREQQSAPVDGTGADPGVSAGTAASDLHDPQLVGADVVSGGAGLLTAVASALLLALCLTRPRRRGHVEAGGAGRALPLAGSSGRHGRRRP